MVEQVGVARIESDRLLVQRHLLVPLSNEPLGKSEILVPLDPARKGLDQALSNQEDVLFFDAGSTQMRADLLTKAINAGKMIYCEKPVADSLTDAIRVARLARQKTIKSGVVPTWWVSDSKFCSR